MDSVVPPAYYTLNSDPAVKTITLTAPYNTLSTEQVISIRNLTKQIEIYNSKDPRNHRAFLTGDDQLGVDIDITNGVLTYVESTGMDNDDKLEIRVDMAGSTGSSYFDPYVTVLSDVAVAAGATNTPVSVDMDESLTQVLVYPINKGASANLIINVYSSPGGTIKALIGTATLSTVTTTTEFIVNAIPKRLLFEAINGDTVNATTYDVICSKRA